MKTLKDHLELIDILQDNLNDLETEIIFDSEHEELTDDFMRCCGYSEADAAEAASCVVELEGMITF